MMATKPTNPVVVKGQIADLISREEFRRRFEANFFDPAFDKARDAGIIKSAAAPRNFGEALVVLGIAMLVLGIGYHVVFMLGLRRERDRMKAAGLIHAESGYPVSLTLIVAVLLLGIGILAVVSMWLHVGPFG